MMIETLIIQSQDNLSDERAEFPVNDRPSFMISVAFLARLRFIGKPDFYRTISGLVTETMALHLAEISSQVTPGAHAVVILDQAGWPTAHDLNLPDNISLLFPPPYSLELNLIENLFQFLKVSVMGLPHGGSSFRSLGMV